jgi:lambda family phage portal protein
MECIVESGEVVILAHTMESEDDQIPLKIQVLEPDHIDTAKDGLPALDENGNPVGWITQGIEFDNRGRRVAYWLYEQHPGAHRLPAKSFVSRRVPAERVIHCYRVDRPGQHRGVSWFAPAIATLQDGADLDDAVIVQQKSAACLTGIITTPEGMPVQLGEQNQIDEVRQRIEPGTFARLQPGQTITFSTPPANQQYEPVVKRNLFRLSAAMGITYEDQTNDYERVNFSSARLARLSHWGNVYHWQWGMLIPLVCEGVWQWAMGAAVKVGLLDRVPRAEWTPPTMPMIEPDKEGLAYQRLLRNGGMSGEEMARERGKDPRRLLDEIQRWQDELDSRGIVLDSDPRKTNQAGALQGESAPKPSPPPIPSDA